MPKSVLIFSHEGDPHADVVEQRLRQRAVTPVRLNAEHSRRAFHMTFTLADPGYRLTANGEEISLDPDLAIWNRRVRAPVADPQWSAAVAEIVRDETRMTWNALLDDHVGHVVSRPNAIRRASNKLSQLARVRTMGGEVMVPDTMVTNDPARALAFFEKHGGNICFKLQRGASLERNGHTMFVYTNKVQRAHLASADAIRAAPILLQEYVEKGRELRITVIGDAVIAVAIYSQDSPVSRIDYRRFDFKRVRHEVVPVPSYVESLCRTLLAHYGLEFGAFDFIETPDGRYVFLELNPNGQWLWLEDRAGAKISETLADYLCRPERAEVESKAG